MNGTGLINDGMERKGYLPARNYVSPEVRFWYRPMTIPVRAIYLDSLSKQPNRQSQGSVSVAMVTSRLVRWDMVYPSDWADESLRGKPVPTNDADYIREHLDPYIEEYMSAVMAGMAPSYVDPKDNEQQQAEDTKLQGLSPEEMLKAMAAAEGERQGN